MPDTIIPQANHAPPQGRSAEINELAKALAMAQGAFEPIERNREVEVKTEKGYTYTFRYATLDCVMASVQKALSANGLAITHLTSGTKLTSLLIHASGQWLSSEWNIGNPDARNKMQAIGSAQTYGQRYNVRLLLNLASEEDDDANAADGNTIQRQNDKPHKPGATGSASSGTDFRPPGPRRMPTSNWTEDARQDGTLDETRQKGTLPTKASVPQVANAVKRVEWVKKSIEGFALAQTKDELQQWWKSEAERLGVIEAAMPAEYERLLKAYDTAIERTAVRAA